MLFAQDLPNTPTTHHPTCAPIWSALVTSRRSMDQHVLSTSTHAIRSDPNLRLHCKCFQISLFRDHFDSSKHISTLTWSSPFINTSTQLRTSHHVSTTPRLSHTSPRTNVSCQCSSYWKLYFSIYSNPVLNQSCGQMSTSIPATRAPIEQPRSGLFLTHCNLHRLRIM